MKPVILLKMNHSKRQSCQQCHYPVNTCVCYAISQVNVPAKITIIQDPSETHHAKNTARVLALAIPSSQIIILDGTTAWPNNLIKDKQRTVVIYPAENAQPIETFISPTGSPSHTHSTAVEHVILLDGSWRKTRKLWLSYPVLNECHILTFKAAPTTQYAIRKTTHTGSMSTLEACAYSLKQLFNTDTAGLYGLLEAMQTHWRRHEHHT